MKKNIIAILIIISIAITGAFAATDSFDVQTSVSGINMMKLTTATFSGNAAALTSASAFTGPFTVTASGAQSLTAYLSTLSNNRTGYTVTMGATPMSSALSGYDTIYIDYTVTCNSVSVTTTGATAVAAGTVVTVNSLTGLSSQSHALSLSVDATSFDAAVEGSYSGTVTFTYTAN